MNFTTDATVRGVFLRHSIIADHKNHLPWVSPWLRSSKTTARVATFASCTARLKPFFRSSSTLKDGSTRNDPSWWLSNVAWAACRALGRAQRTLSTKSPSRPTPPYLRWCSTKKALQPSAWYAGKNGPLAGPDGLRVQRNAFVCIRSAPTQ